MSAFTLIELLIVITIMAILAALLFPVFGPVREGAVFVPVEGREPPAHFGATSRC